MALFTLLSALLLSAASAQLPASGPACATTCQAQDCDGMGIRWGRYCGVSHTGCDGVAPCDGYDKCCEAHDACVSGGGLTASDVLCHSTFTSCLSSQLASGAKAWTSKCSAKQVVKTMTDGINLASSLAAMFSGMGGGAGGGGSAKGRRGEL